MSRTQGRTRHEPLRMLVLAMWSTVVALLAVAPASAMAGQFVGSPPLPAHESAWILIDGDEQGAGATATLDAAERLATNVLHLQRGKSVFRFSPSNHDLAALGKSFGRSGTVGKTLAEVSPAVVVLMIEGKTLPSGAGYGDGMLSASWLDKRIQDIYAVCPSALVVVVAEPMAGDAREKLLVAAAKRQKRLAAADKQSAPLYLLLGADASGKTNKAQWPAFFSALEKSDPAVASLRGEVAKVFAGAPTAQVGIVGTLFVIGLLGAADDQGGNGYDILKIERWMSLQYGAVIAALGKQGTLESGAHWGDDDATISPAYPLKRRRYTIGVCVASFNPLPARPGESDADRVARTKADLGELAAVLANNAKETLRNAPGALVVEVLDPSKLPPPVPASGPAACASTRARNRFDAWVELFHKNDGHYVFQVARVRTREAVMSSPEPPPDRDKTRESLEAAGRDIVRPLAIYKPVSEREIVAAAKKPPAPERQKPGPPLPPPGFVKALGLFQQAKSAFDRGELHQALPLYRQSFEAYPTAEALFSAAECEDRLGMKEDARRDQEALVAQFPSDNPYAAATRQRLSARFGTNGDSSTRAPMKPLRRVGFVIGGVGLAGLTAGAVTGILAIAKKNQVAGLCPVAKECTVEGVRVGNAAHTFATVSTVASIAGAALVGTGVALVVAGRESAVSVRASGAGITLGGVF